MRTVHREDFVPFEQRANAADDRPLPIGCAQTISQPSLVARMTDELHLTSASRVLEIGTGSGYQTAILAEIAREIFTIERIAALAHSARERLDWLGYRNIRFHVGDGAVGWPTAAPFDAIVVTAAPPVIPPALIQQLACGGRMVVPIGEERAAQELMLVTKDEAGRVKLQELFGVYFVPLISDKPRGSA